MPVVREDFTLWTKNTLAYLNRLPHLLEAMPEATFIACVRHPADTIASWSRTFPHLRDADVEKFPIGHPMDPFLSSEQREELAEIAACHELPRRRALLWNYLTSIILQNRARLVVVRLEDLARNPQFFLKNALATSASLNASPFYALQSLCPNVEILEETCSPIAEEFGYAFGEPASNIPGLVSCGVDLVSEVNRDQAGKEMHHSNSAQFSTSRLRETKQLRIRQ